MTGTACRLTSARYTSWIGGCRMAMGAEFLFAGSVTPGARPPQAFSCRGEQLVSSQPDDLRLGPKPRCLPFGVTPRGANQLRAQLRRGGPAGGVGKRLAVADGVGRDGVEPDAL